MYVNKATVTTSPEESFIKFSCIGPIFNENDEVKSVGEIESCQIIMPRAMLVKLRDLITNVIETEGKQEK